MRGTADGTQDGRFDDSGLYRVGYEAMNGAFAKIAKLDESAPATIKLDGQEYVRNEKGIHVGPVLAE